ncbi:hypothetical protein JOE11_003052 [Robbsia andropogonis]|uniref:hypothetical protein n=1 Tax=Robbsia andropogonis TaxID=28092 RepID=UPI003D1B781E
MPTALRRSKSLPALLAVFAVLVVIATIAAVLISNVMPSRHAQTSSDGTDDMTSGVGRASRIAAVTPLSRPGASGVTKSDTDTDTDIGATPGDTASSASTLSASGSAATTDVLPASDAQSANAAGMRHSHLRAAMHRPAVDSDSMRSGGTLRADIARYNAERRSGHRPGVLHAASVPNVHSLWDEIPGPMSDVYRN